MANGGNGSVFAQGAGRLEQVARSLKSQQIEEQQGSRPLQIASSRLTAVSPDEMWARQFSSQCIGPACFKVAPGSDMAMPPLTQTLESVAPARQNAASQPQRSATMPAAAAKPMPMGALIGKPARRGFFGRLFRSA